MRYTLILFLFLATFSYAKMVDAVAVVIGDDIVTLYDITKEMQTAHLSKKQALDTLIRKKLEEIEIKKRDIGVSEDEVYDEIRRLAAANKMSIAQFYDVVRESNGLDSSQLKEKIKARLLAQKLYQSIAMSKMKEPSENEIKEYFKLHKSEFVHPAFFDVTIYTAPSQDLLLKKTHNPMFYSVYIKQDTQRIAYERLSPSLAKLLDNTKEGSFSQIIPDGRGGYMTFYLQKRGEENRVDFEKIKPLVTASLMNKKQREILDDYFAKLRNRIDIKILRD